MSADVIIGIDLGTTNSEVAVWRGDSVEVLKSEEGDPILPSVVGFDLQGNLLVGHPARNQLLIAPERTVKSIKRLMGEETLVKLGDKEFSPQEISAMILRALKQRAEAALGHPVSKAVITVPAFFNDAQRRATREAGELAGLEVVRIINEPTAAVLTYDPHPPDRERILVYDLGGGTFDVSIAQVEGGVVEILSSHGDTHLGGDDFDQLLLDYVCNRFQTEHQVDLRAHPVAKSRVLRAVEEAKKRLSTEVTVRIEEEFITEVEGKPVNLVVEIERETFENLIDPLLEKTLMCLDKALEDAKLLASDIHKVLLVGGATRTPLVRSLLSERMGRPVHTEIEPDLAVAMGAAVQGGLIAGAEVGPVLVDITPHTLGIETVGPLLGMSSPYCFSPIIPRNSSLPAVQTEVYTTTHDNQSEAMIRVFQGENDDTRYNDFVGEFLITDLSPVPAGNEIAVKLELDLNGILKVTATERATGLSKQIVIDNAAERFKTRGRADALSRLETAFATLSGPAASAMGDDPLAPVTVTVGQGADPTALEANLPADLRDHLAKVELLSAKAQRVLERGRVAPEDAEELRDKLTRLSEAARERRGDVLKTLLDEVSELIYYIEGGA